MRRIIRALVGALWSAPLRFISIPAISAGMMLAAGGTLTADNLLQPMVVLSGVWISVALRFVDNLAVEFAIFPYVIKFIERPRK